MSGSAALPASGSWPVGGRQRSYSAASYIRDGIATFREVDSFVHGSTGRSSPAPIGICRTGCMDVDIYFCADGYPYLTFLSSVPSKIFLALAQLSQHGSPRSSRGLASWQSLSLNVRIIATQRRWHRNLALARSGRKP